MRILFANGHINKAQKGQLLGPKRQWSNDEYQTYANLQHITEQVLRVLVATEAHR